MLSWRIHLFCIYSNTSNVNLYRDTGEYPARDPCIQIHPMLIFIRPVCCCQMPPSSIQIHPMLIFIAVKVIVVDTINGYSNTSNVNLYQTKGRPAGRLFLYSNTSNVNLYRLWGHSNRWRSTNSNTSNVNLYHYNLCFYLSSQ